MSHTNLAGRCLDCGRQVESSAGCTPCWQRRMSEAASTVLVLKDEPVFIYSALYEAVEKPVFARLLDS